MATIRHSLEKDVFEPADEKLIYVLNVTKFGKKKKCSFLCITVGKDKPVFIHQVTKNDKDVYKKKNSWPLRELSAVDGKEGDKDTADLDLTFERVYKWVASSHQEKFAFIQVLWKLCARYLPKQKPQFISIPSELSEGTLSPANHNVVDITQRGFDSVDIVLDEDSDYKVLSEKEQIDLEKLMDQCDSAVSNAEAFAEQLSKDLSSLDGANVHSMMASEVQVQSLMEMIDRALIETSTIESRLDSYDCILQHVKDSMDKMADKTISIEQINLNNCLLLEELDSVINKLDFPLKYQKILESADLNKTSNLPLIIEAAVALQRVIVADIPQHLNHLQAVKDQKKKFDKLRRGFSQMVSRHLNNLFIHLGNDPGETLGLHAERLTLPRRSAIHKELICYRLLMHWMRALDPKSFELLLQTYVTSLAKLYERDIRLFFDEAKQRISGGRRLRGSGSNQDLTASNVSGKLSTQLKLGIQTRGGVGGALLGIEKDQWGSELDSSERQKFDEIFERVLSELEPLCLAEQEFCVSFFNMNEKAVTNANKMMSDSSSSASTPVSTGSEDSANNTAMTVSLGKGKQMTKELRVKMAELFPNLEAQLSSFINTYDHADSYCCMYIYVRLSAHVLTAEDTGSFLSITFGSCLIQAKRNFDRFMTLHLQSIAECRVLRKKCGIVPFVVNFEEFAQTAENVFRKSDRRSDLDKWYLRIMAAIFENVLRISCEHQKSPADVIKMENYHMLHQLLFQLKLPAMDAQRKEAKQRYQDALSNYVILYFGRPLEKLNFFFDGVTAKVSSGVRESEIGYQLAFSKQELRKVIKEYPGKEVKKGLEQLYKKVEKHLSVDGNLLQVVWRAMQEEFIRQYKLIDDLIHRCYPGGMVTLEFTIDDILNYFSDIAQSH